MKAECEAFHSGVDALKDAWWDESLTAPKVEAKAEAEVSTPTSKDGHHREGKPKMSFPRESERAASPPSTTMGKETMDQRLRRQSTERVAALRREVVLQ